MGDHFSSPRVFFDPAADITDVFVFPSPDRPGRVVFILNVFPGATPAALFSDAVTYRFRIRTVTSSSPGAAPRYLVDADEYVIDFNFGAPSEIGRHGGSVQAGTCTSPSGAKISFEVGDEVQVESQGPRIFVGARLDPFFLDVVGVRETRTLHRLMFKPRASNALHGQNVLSIVLELDAAAAFGPAVGPLLAVVGETVTSGGYPVRLEHSGRPELKNFVISDDQFDSVNSNIELRDLYNSEDPFNLSPYYVAAYRSRLNANLAFYDRLDGTTDWPLNDQGDHPLTKFLLADFLVLDVSKPFSEGSFLEIDRALLAGRPHTTCGGRPPNDDIVDEFFTLLVGGVDGARISDGVDQATRPASRIFPYLATPNPSPPRLTPPFALPPASAEC